MTRPVLESGGVRQIPVWDLPTRLFHWSLLVAVVVSVVAIEVLDDATLHVKSGRVVLGLIVFRLLWGLVGSSTAQFHRFVRGPSAVLRYLKSESPAYVGHNPLGALSVLALLASLSVQVLSGLGADDEIFTTGPLTKYLSSDWVSIANRVHHWNKWVLLALVITHIVAIIWYARRRGNNLVGPMITGRQAVAEPAAGGPLPMQKRAAWVSWLAIALAAGAAWGIFRL